MIGHCSSGSSRSFHERRLNVETQTPDDGPVACHTVELVLGVSKMRDVKKNHEDGLLAWSTPLGTRNCVGRQGSENSEVCATSDDCLESLVDREWRTLNGETRISTISENQTVDSCMTMLWLWFALFSATVGWCNFTLAT